jgi:hypothetical protein
VWKRDIYRSLFEVCRTEGREDPNNAIFYSLMAIFKPPDELRRATVPTAKHLVAYAYVGHGFRR